MAVRAPLVLLFFATALASACAGSRAPVSSSLPGARAAAAAEEIAVTEIAAGACTASGRALPRPLEPGRGDRIVLAKEGKRRLAYVANEDDAAVHTIDVGAANELAVTQLPGSPSALVGLSDGRVAVALRDRNEILIVEPSSDLAQPMKLVCRAEVAAEPVGLAAVRASDGAERILVTSGLGHALTILGASDLGEQAVVDLPRDPRAVVAHDGKAFVSHVTSATVSVVDLAGRERSSVDLLGKQRPPGLPRAGDREAVDTLVRGGQAYSLAVDEDGLLYAAMVTVDPGPAKMTSAYGGTERPINPFVGVIDLAAQKRIPVSLPFRAREGRPCTLPRAAAVRDGALYVTCAGIDELLELEARADNAVQVIRRRVRVAGGPLGLAVDEESIVVLSQFDREVAIVGREGRAAPRRIALSRPDEVDPVFERGRKIFHDSFDLRISADGRACASCHPDGRDDGNTWSTPDGPRQTITLAGRVAGSAPYGWFGEHPTLRAHLEHTTRRLSGTGIDSAADRDALETYLLEMKGPAGSRRHDAHVIERGRALFHDAASGCGTCHAAGGTDRARHDVGSGDLEEASLKFDTPSLGLAAGSAPFFHDGRYATLGEVLAGGDHKMGHAAHLDAAGRDAVVAYLESIGDSVSEARSTTRTFAPAALHPLAADFESPLERDALEGAPPRNELATRRLDPGSLPEATRAVEVARDAWDKKAEDATGGTLEKPFAWNDGCAAVPGHAAAFLQLDWRSTGMTRRLERCTPAPDADGIRAWETVLYRTIDPLEGGRIRFEEHRGWINVATREVRITESVVAEAAPVVEGLAFAFRERCAACEASELESLVLIVPNAGFPVGELFSVQRLPIGRGTTGHLEAEIAPWHLEPWAKATGTRFETGSAIGRPMHVLLRVDATRAFSESPASLVIGSGTFRRRGFF